MVARQVLDTYSRMGSEAEIHPVKLIHMLYERVLLHLTIAEEGVLQMDPGKRGENIGKAIAIITELNSALSSDDESEAVQFLRGLYTAVLLELPKVSLTNDIQILRQSVKYMQQLKEIWQQTAMVENGFGVDDAFDVIVNVQQYKQSPPAAAGRDALQPVNSSQGGISFSV